MRADRAVDEVREHHRNLATFGGFLGLSLDAANRFGYRNIDFVIGKAFRVLGHAEPLEPVLNLLHRGPIAIYPRNRRAELSSARRDVVAAPPKDSMFVLVKSRHWGRCDGCPLYPRKRTFNSGALRAHVCSF
jgi:hypothetical protein